MTTIRERLQKQIEQVRPMTDEDLTERTRNGSVTYLGNPWKIGDKMLFAMVTHIDNISFIKFSEDEIEVIEKEYDDYGTPPAGSNTIHIRPKQ
jgi:hypothetical protein